MTSGDGVFGRRRESHVDPDLEPLLAVLKKHFIDVRRVLEIGSGTGQHAIHFASVFPGAQWQTSDVEARIAGIQAWLDDARLPNLPPPLILDVNGPWPVEHRYDAAFTANTFHVLSWDEVRNIFSGLDEVLDDNAVFVVYGPLNYGGRPARNGNPAPDESLARSPATRGAKDFEAVYELASGIGLKLIADHAMHANNRTLVWKRGL